jgi:hypothetical protein
MHEEIFRFDNLEWKEVLYSQYKLYKKVNPNVELKSIIPAAKRIFIEKKFDCNIDLNLIANAKKSIKNK